jgi:signal peptidase
MMDAHPAIAPSRARRLALVAAGGLGRLLLLAGVVILAATYVPSLLGYHRYVLVGHSMEPTIHRGSLVFDEVVPVSALRRGDVVTFVPAGLTKPLSHRIVSRRTIHGRIVFQTKGDNNAVADPGQFTFNEPTQARVRFSVPYVGWVYIALGNRAARLWIAVIPGILLALWSAAAVWRQGGALVQAQRTGAGAS